MISLVLRAHCVVVFCSALPRSQQTAMGLYVEKILVSLISSVNHDNHPLLFHCCCIWKFQMHYFWCPSRLFPWKKNHVSSVLPRKQKSFHKLSMSKVITAATSVTQLNIQNELQASKLHCGKHRQVLTTKENVLTWLHQMVCYVQPSGKSLFGKMWAL